MSDKPDARAEWSIMDRTWELLAVHCRVVAYQEASGWECAGCGEYIESRDIPGWTERRKTLAASRTTAKG